MNLEIYLPEVSETQPKRKKSESQGGEFVVPGQLINTEAGFLRFVSGLESNFSLFFKTVSSGDMELLKKRKICMLQ